MADAVVNYVDVNLNCFLNAAKILYFVPYDGNSALAKKVRLSAETQPPDAPDKLINLTRGRVARTLIALDTNQFVLVSIQASTLARRLRGGKTV